MYVLAGIAYLFGVFHNSAKLALIPDLVAHNELLPANATLSLIGRFATVFGIVGGGLILSASIWQRLGWPSYAAGFYIDAASFAFSAVMTIFIGARIMRGPQPQAPAARLTRRHPMHALRAALGLVWHDHALRFAFFTVAFMAVMAASGYVLLVVSIQSVLGAGTKGVGLLGGMTAGGMILGSLAVGTVGARFDKGTIILVAAALLGLAMLIGAVAYTFATLLPIALLGGALLAPIWSRRTRSYTRGAAECSRDGIFHRDLVLGAVLCSRLGGWRSRSPSGPTGWKNLSRHAGGCGILFALAGAIAAGAHLRGRRRQHVR